MKKLLFVPFLMLIVVNLNAQICGCTDPLANNYNPLATTNDGTCTYNTSIVSPETSWPLPTILNETSGLIWWNSKICTHNDDADKNIYALDTSDINNYSFYELAACTNIEWEEISQDETYLYLGDFGNNANGNRTNLKILRIEKNSLLQNFPLVDTFNFSYSLQTDLSPTGSNNTDFDCEAFIVTSDSIYLFTKEWISNKCTIYSLPKSPGSYIAQFNSSYDVQGLITGATYLEQEKIVLLCGYSELLQPFLVLLYDFQDDNFFSGNKRKVNLNLPFHQIEGIASGDPRHYFLSNEKFTQSVVSIPAKLHIVDLSSYLNTYLDTNSVKINTFENIQSITVYPNPASDYLTLEKDELQLEGYYKIFNISGVIIQEGVIPNNAQQNIDIHALSKGVYFFQINNQTTYKFIKR